jgi:hypothetical protein
MKSSKTSVKLNSDFVVDRLVAIDIYGEIQSVYKIVDEYKAEFCFTPLRQTINKGMSDIMQSSATTKLCKEYRDRLIEIVRNPGVVLADIAYYLGQQSPDCVMDVELMALVIDAAGKLDY